MAATLPLADAIIERAGNPKTTEPHVIADVGMRRRIGQQITAMLRGARRYYLDEEATAMAVSMGMQHPDLLVGMLRRARTPFPKVWLEWPLAAALTAANTPLEDDVPERTGAYIERLDEERPRYRLSFLTVTSTGDIRNALYAPISIVYDLEEAIGAPTTRGAQLYGDELLIAECVGREALGGALPLLRATLAGAAYSNGVGAALDKHEAGFRLRLCDELASHARYVIAPVAGNPWKAALASANPAHQQLARVTFRQTLAEYSGMWRTVVSILALINANDVASSDTAWRAGERGRMVGGKVMPYLEHRLVRLNLPRRSAEPRMVRWVGEGVPRRRHEVSGHWKHSRRRGDPACEHVYVRETPLREACVLCGAKKWWVNDFQRGDASLGFVTKDRKVMVHGG